jgi:peptidylprolyl isomerase
MQWAALTLAALTLSACGSSGGDSVGTAAAPRYPSAKSPPVHVPSGPPPKEVVVKELKKGKGAVVPPVTTQPKVELDVLYTAVKWNGELFEERQNPRAPFEVEFGAHLNPGWEEGLEGMRVGGRRELIVPVSASWGTGSDEALVYVVDLVSLKKIGHSQQVRGEEQGPTMSKEEIAKLPPLKMPKPSGLPPHRFTVINLRKGSGPVVGKTDAVSIRFLEDTYPQALEGRQGGLSGGVVRWSSWSLDEASRGLRLGLPGMRVGGRRELIVPPKVAYPRWKPSWGYAPYVSVYVVDLLGVEPRT